MNLKWADVTKKGIKETLRDTRGFLLLLGIPVLLIVLFAFAFGGGNFLSGGSIPHQIVVVNEDAGIKLAANNTTKNVNYGTEFVAVLQNITANDTTTKVFHLNNASIQQAEAMLKSRSIDALIIIPKNFSLAFNTMLNNSTRTAISSSVGQQALANTGANAAANTAALAGSSASTPGANVKLPAVGNVSSSLQLEGDAGYTNYMTTQMYVNGVFTQYKKDVQSNATANAAPDVGGGIFGDNIPVEMLALTGTQSFTMYDYMVPGLIVFSLLLQLSLISGSLVKDVETGLFDRLKLSKIRGFDLLFGTFLTWTFMTIGQLILFLIIAILLGFHYQGGIGSLGLAMFIGVLAGMASISLALVISSFTKTYVQAMSLGAILATPLGFMAGAFIPLPPQLLGEFGAQTYQIYELLPWTHAVKALRSVLTYGTGLSPNVIFQIYWLIVLTAIIFVIGVVTYSRVRLRAEK
jgi:ABC-2 type transport system permease protein